MALYLALHRALVIVLRRTPHAANGLVIATIASDMLVLFATVALVTPPEHYHRALIISIFTVQLTQLFFGWTATIANLVFIALGYMTLIGVAMMTTTTTTRATIRTTIRATAARAGTPARQREDAVAMMTTRMTRVMV